MTDPQWDDALTDGASVQERRRVGSDPSAELSAQPTHHEVRALLTDLLAGTLPAPQDQQIRAHLQNCADCRAFYNTFRRTVHLMETLSPHQAPPSAKRRILDRLPPEVPQRR